MTVSGQNQIQENFYIQKLPITGRLQIYTFLKKRTTGKKPDSGVRDTKIAKKYFKSILLKLLF